MDRVIAWLATVALAMQLTVAAFRLYHLLKSDAVVMMVDKATIDQKIVFCVSP